MTIDDDEFNEIVRAFARKTDPDTSHEAAASVNDIAANQKAVYAVLRTSPMTHEQLIEQYRRTPGVPNQSDSGIRSRCADLVKMGLVEFTGEKRPISTGRNAKIWRVT